jgi:D-beta-D-heptose 7-phosphate kinase/D-beta-D-heptose 1-phosphate adenosyltransferase
VGCVGADDAGRELAAKLHAAGVSTDFVEVDGWPTIVKLRVLSRGQQLIRSDFERPLPVPVADRLLERLARHLADASVVVLEDYDKGVVDAPEQLIERCRAAGVSVVVDPKFKPFARFAGAAIVKPNAVEIARAVGAWRSQDELIGRTRALCVDNDVGAFVVTRGGAGVTVVTADDDHHIPARAVEVFDVTGAGDTFAAALAVTHALGWNPVRSAQLANLASSIVVTKSGTAAVSGPELALLVQEHVRRDRGMLSRDELVRAVADAKAAGERIVFTNGCFDILHAGHVSYLEEARTLGDRLVVAVNDDASVTRLKGEGRPVNELERRARVLAGLKAVDWVVGFPEDTPVALLEALQPHVLVKGGDYAPDQVVGADVVRANGGEVKVLSHVEDCSTTLILERARGT